MKKVFIALISMLFLASCSALDAVQAVSSLGSPSGVEAELVVGSKEQTMENQVGDNANVINNTQEIPFEFMVLLVLGWLLPSPQEIWGGLVKLMPWVNK